MVCNTCKNNLPEEAFSFQSKFLGKRNKKCKECTKEYLKLHYLNNKQSYFNSRKRSKFRCIAYVKELKTKTPCKDCGKFFPDYVMDFDHKRNKEFGIAEGKHKKTIGILKKEIAKCDIVCANCHRIRTHNRANPT